MNHRFLSDGSELRSYGGGNLSRKSGSSGLFWWSILITFLMGLATFCWFFSIMVFQHPEKPFNYSMLAKLDKLPILRKFSTYSAPLGETRSAHDLLAAYYTYTPEQLNIANSMLKRSYIRNYEKQDPPVYMSGEYQVIEVRPLDAQDVVDEGWVVRTRSIDLEDVDVEVLFPGLAVEAAPYQVGDKLKLDRRKTFAALVHVQKLNADRICGTVVPIVYDGFDDSEGGSISMTPPAVLNMGASWPVTKDPGAGLASSFVPEEGGVALTQ